MEKEQIQNEAELISEKISEQVKELLFNNWPMAKTFESNGIINLGVRIKLTHSSGAYTSKVGISSTKKLSDESEDYIDDPNGEGDLFEDAVERSILKEQKEEDSLDDSFLDEDLTPVDDEDEDSFEEDDSLEDDEDPFA